MSLHHFEIKGCLTKKGYLKHLAAAEKIGPKSVDYFIK